MITTNFRSFHVIVHSPHMLINSYGFPTDERIIFERSRCSYVAQIVIAPSPLALRRRSAFLCTKNLIISSCIVSCGGSGPRLYDLTQYFVNSADGVGKTKIVLKTFFSSNITIIEARTSSSRSSIKFIHPFL